MAKDSKGHGSEKRDGYSSPDASEPLAGFGWAHGGENTHVPTWHTPTISPEMKLPGIQAKMTESDRQFVTNLQAARALAQDHPKTVAAPAGWNQHKPGYMGPSEEGRQLYAKLSARATSTGIDAAVKRGILHG